MDSLPELVGKPVAEASELARNAGYSLRVIQEDGVERIVTMEIRSDRINVEVEWGRVTAIRNVG